MQTNAMAEKKKIEVDGVELPGLVSVGEYKLEKSRIEVPSFNRLREIQSGIIKIPAIELKYKVERSSNTLEFYENWYLKNESHDVTIIRTDADGVEFSRRLLPDCECVDFTDPAYDASNPEYASVTVSLVPWDFKMLKAE